MTRDDIIRMAREAGGSESDPSDLLTAEILERFATIVAAAEREACREIAFRMAHSDEDAVDVSHAIRARGET